MSAASTRNSVGVSGCRPSGPISAWSAASRCSSVASAARRGLPRRTMTATRASSSLTWKGLLRWSSPPAANPARTSCSWSRAVRKSTGTSMPRARSAWQTSRPSESGRPMSSTTASNRVSGPGPTVFRAEVPSTAVTTSRPASRSPRATAPRSAESSSTTSTRAPSTTGHGPWPETEMPTSFRPCSERCPHGGAMTRPVAPSTSGRTLLNKVPEVTVFFWIIKVLSTTVGETFADFLSGLGLGLSGTTLVMSAAFVAVLVWQFRTRQYVPGVYWLTVVLVSVVGTLITDNLTDALGIPLELSTAVFAVALGITFAVWYSAERTLSIHSIVTVRREAFYWLAILFTFALGTAAGDLVSERFGVGYWATALIVALLIAAVAFSHRVFGVSAVLTFWIAYVLTRPLGASLGDGLSQPHADGGLGLGTTWTSVIFLVTIVALVGYLSVSKRDQSEVPAEEAPAVRA